MKAAKNNQILFDQANHSAGDSISLGNKVLAYTVKCHPASSANLWVGLSEDASEGNLLQPGESLTIQMTVPGYYLTDELYVQFDPTATGGRGLVIVLRDTGEEAC